MSDYREVNTSQHEAGQEQRVVSFRATQIIWLVLGIIEVLIGLRFVFKLIGVNAANSFATFLYNITNIFVAPFASLSGAPAAGGMVLEVSSLLAMIVYLLVAWGIERIVYVIFYRPRGPVSTRQTTYSDHTAQQGQTTSTNSSTSQGPAGASQTTTTEQTNTRTPPSNL
jgi:hypothetical protein